MKIFLDTARLEDIEKAADTGLIDGVTTNPSLLAKQCTLSLSDFVKGVSSFLKGSIHLEVTAQSHQDMLRQAEKLVALSSQVAIKVPMNVEGLKTCVALKEKGIAVNVTLCFCSSQALLAAKAGADYVSVFLGRLDDIGTSGVQRLQEIIGVYKNYNVKTKILAASIRTPYHIIQAAQVGSDVVTIPFHLFHNMYEHPLTHKGLDLFQADWKSLPQPLF